MIDARHRAIAVAIGSLANRGNETITVRLERTEVLLVGEENSDVLVLDMRNHVSENLSPGVRCTEIL